MEKLSVHQKGSKQAKAKKKAPIKVVYISNPMKVKATAEEFRSLVQELTGRDSTVSDVSKFQGQELDGGGVDPVPAPDTASDTGAFSEGRAEHGVDPCEMGYKTALNPFDYMLDEGFAPQMLDNFPGFFDRYGCGLRNFDKV